MVRATSTSVVSTGSASIRTRTWVYASGGMVSQEVEPSARRTSRRSGSAAKVAPPSALNAHSCGTSVAAVRTPSASIRASHADAAR